MEENKKILDKWFHFREEELETLSGDDKEHLYYFEKHTNPIVDLVEEQAKIFVKGQLSKLEDDSILFFGSIAKNDSFEDFKEKVKNSNENEIEEDILIQIYNNSTICNKKFENYNKAIIDMKKVLVILLVIVIAMFFNI